MSKQEQHDLREYHIVTEPIDISNAAAAWIPCPEAGEIVNILALAESAVGVGDTDLTFEINGTTVKVGAAAATVTLVSAASAAGDAYAVKPDTDNVLRELEDGDAIATAGSAIEVISDATGTGTVRLVFTIRS
jgi:hypothetical protein